MRTGVGARSKEQTMSDVEKLYNAIAAKFGVQKKFSELTPMEVNILCQGVSMILQVVHD